MIGKGETTERGKHIAEREICAKICESVRDDFLASVDDGSEILNHEVKVLEYAAAIMRTHSNVGLGTCPDCGVNPGDLHAENCDIERCPDCGGQYISCGCSSGISAERLPWSGEWPGVMECREFGWYSKLLPGRGWVTCDKAEPEASEDLNRLDRDAVWDKEHGRFVLSANA